MRIRYEQLFSIGFANRYYVDGKSQNDLVIEPTRNCMQQMSRFKILTRPSFDGIMLVYECSPATNDATPFRPILAEEKFAFKVSVNNANFWYYADVNNWQKDKIFLLKNAVYNTPGNINLHTGPLNLSIAFRPMEFKHILPLENVPGLFEVRDPAGNVLAKTIVRAKTAAEPAGTTEPYLVSLRGYKDGSYVLRHINSGGNVDAQVYCSEDYSPDTLAIIEITYKTGVGWTGVAPFQKYMIDISSRSSDWIFDVHLRNKNGTLYKASDLTLRHVPVAPEPLRSFSVVGVADDVNGFVQFKSNVQLVNSQRPMRLQLLKLPSLVILDPLPLPSSITLQKDAMNNLVNRIVVNV